MSARRRLVSIYLFLVVAVALYAPYTSAQVTADREAEIKAGIVGALGKLVAWPSRPVLNNGRFRIGILGKDPFQDGAINHLDRKLAGQATDVERFAAVDDYKPCHILVVSPEVDLKAALAKTQDQPVLVLTQAPGLAKQGSVMNLVKDEQMNKMLLEVNPVAAKAARLEIDPRVYRLPMVKIVR